MFRESPGPAPEKRLRKGASEMSRTASAGRLSHRQQDWTNHASSVTSAQPGHPPSGLIIYKAQPTLKPLPGDYGLVKMPGAPAHVEAMLLGWRFSHAVVYVGHGQLVEAWFDCVRERSVAEYPARDISWFGVRCAPDGAQVTQSRRDRVAEYVISRLGQPYDYSAWPAVFIRYYGGIDLSGLYVFDLLASCSGLVAKAYQAADLNLIDKRVLNLVTPDDLDPESLQHREKTDPSRCDQAGRPATTTPASPARLTSWT
jgi:hypothetical protein